MLRLTHILPLLVALAASIFATSCSSSDAQLRIVQAVPDINPDSVDIYLDGNKVASGVAFRSVTPATGYMSTGSGSRHLQVFPAGQTSGTTYFDGTISSLGAGTQYTLVLTGFSVTGTPNAGVVAALFTDNNLAPSSGNTEIRVIHASPTWNFSYYPNGMDIYILAPGTPVEGSPTFHVAYKSASTYQSAPAGTYSVMATPPGLPVAYLTLNSYAFNSGDIRTVVFVDAAGGGLGGTPLVLSDLGQ